MSIYIDDITNNLEDKKISFANIIDSQKLPSDVSYVRSCILKSDSLAEDYESVALPCSCKNLCSASCSCCSDANSYTDGKLSETYNIHTGRPIIECSSLCTCYSHCSNRVVQRGMQFFLQVFQTQFKGFGVRTTEFIPKLAFVCEYAGELIDAQEACCRMKNKTFDEPNYIYVLKEYSSRTEFTQTIIDPTYVGNVGRYLNHSCSPNLVSVPVRANSMTPRICFFAKADIAPFQELTYNYGGEDVLSENISDLYCGKDYTKARRCQCDSLNCVGFLPFNNYDWIK